MPLIAAVDADLEAVAELVNSAYRGETSRQGWTTEADYLDGQRTDAETLRRALSVDPGAFILTLRDDPTGPLLGTAWLEPARDGDWYLGMLTVRSDLQDRQLGRTVLAGAEAAAAARGATRIVLTVVHIRDTLIGWYERRGYRLTGEVRPFPYGDESLGIPRRDDLTFVVMDKVL